MPAAVLVIQARLTSGSRGPRLTLTDISLWRAARMAGVSLREMIQHAVAHGLRPAVDEETIAEDLAAWSS